MFTHDILCFIQLSHTCPRYTSNRIHPVQRFRRFLCVIQMLKFIDIFHTIYLKVTFSKIYGKLNCWPTKKNQFQLKNAHNIVLPNPIRNERNRNKPNI